MGIKTTLFFRNVGWYQVKIFHGRPGSDSDWAEREVDSLQRKAEIVGEENAIK
jgi:hypothetical protein